MECITLADRSMVAAQIGRPARGLDGVWKRCDYGFPQVVQVHPWIDRKPFPTLYWLTCPFLQRAISRLEADGWVKRLEQHLATHRGVAEAMDQAHRAYIAERRSALPFEEWQEIDAAGLGEAFTARGIGGIRDWRTLKCLHLHAAHALATENPMGQAVLSMLPAIQCDPKEVICSTL